MISQELTQFAHDYVSQKRPDISDGLSNGEISTIEARRIFEELFTSDDLVATVNTDRLPPREFFASQSVADLKDKIKELRKVLKLDTWIPFNYWVAFAETSIIRNDPNKKKRYTDIANTGLAQGHLREVMRFANDVEIRDLQHLIEHQSPDPYRSIVELVSNAVDFSSDDGKVSLNVGENGFEVVDFGSGMSLMTLAENLTIPFLSGARELDKASIGKFGMGFLTVLNNLRQDGDYVIITTSQDGSTGIEMKFQNIRGKLCIHPPTTATVNQKGTSVLLHAADFDDKRAVAYAQEFLQYKTGTQIRLNNELAINTPEKRVNKRWEIGKNEYVGLQIEFAQGDDEAGGLAEKDESGKSQCKAVICVNGIKVTSRNLKGFHVPSMIVIDLPYSTNIPESRNVVPYDVNVQNSLCEIVKHVEDLDLPSLDCAALLNALGLLIMEIEHETVMDKKPIDVMSLCEKKMIGIVEGEGNNMTLVPACKQQEEFEDGNVVFFDPVFNGLMDNYIEKHTDIAEKLLSKEFSIHIANFRSVKPVAVVVGKRIFINKIIWEQTRGAPGLLLEYLNLSTRNKANVFASDENEIDPTQPAPEKDVYYGENFEKRCYDALENIGGRRQLASDLLFPPPSNEKLFLCSLFAKSAIENEIAPVEQYIDNATTAKPDINALMQQMTEKIRSLARSGEKLLDYRGDVIDPESFSEYANFLQAYWEKNVNTIVEACDRIHILMSVFKSEASKLLIANSNVHGEKDFCKNVWEKLVVIYPQSMKGKGDEYMDSQKKYAKYSDKAQPVLFSFRTISSILKSYIPFLSSGETKIEQIEMSILYNLFNILTGAIQSHEMYLEGKSKLNGDERLAHIYEKFLSIKWPPQICAIGQALADDEGSRFRNDVHERESFNDIAEALQNNSELALFFEQTIFPLLDQKEIGPEQAGFLIALYVNPEFAVWGMSEYEGLERIHVQPLLAHLDPKTSNIDSIKEVFQRSHSSFNRSLGVDSMEEYQEKVEPIRQAIRSNPAGMIKKYKSITGLEEYQDILRTRQVDFARLHEDSHYRQNRVQFEILNPQRIVFRGEGYLSGFSERKIEIIKKTLAKNFDPKKWKAQDAITFELYINRVYALAHLDDEVFEHIQSWLTSGYEYTFSAAKHGPYSYEVMGSGILEVIIKNHERISRIQTTKLAKIWKVVFDKASDWEMKQPDRLQRLIDIFDDISKKSASYQNNLITTLEDTRRGAYEYAAIFDDNYPIANLPSDLQAYILYYRGRGELKTQDESLDKPTFTHKTSIANLMALRRVDWRTYSKLANEPENLDSVANLQVDNNLFTIRRELMHAVNHLPVSDPNLWLRELIQNAYDASLGDESGRRMIDVRQYRTQNESGVIVEDRVGMSFEQIVKNLLTPNVSSKSGDKTNRGRFGVGFFSIFQNAKRVEIDSGNSKQNTRLIIEPLRNKQGEIYDFVVSYDVVESNKKGTSIKKVFMEIQSDLDNAKIHAAVNRYGRYIPVRDLDVSLNGEKINYDGNIIASASTESIGDISVLEGSDCVLLQGNLFVCGLPEYIWDAMPTYVADRLKKAGFILNLNTGVELIRTRTDLANKEKVIPELKSVVPELAIRSLIRAYTEGRIDVNLIPYDYFWHDGFPVESADRGGDSEIENDANIINSGGSISDWEKYLDQHNTMLLLTLLKTIDVRGEKLSLKDIAERVFQGADYKKDELPSYLATLVSQAKEREKMTKATNTEKSFERYSLTEAVVEKLTNQSSAHLVFMLMMTAFKSGKTNQMGIVNTRYPLRAFASSHTRNVFWNWHFADDKIRGIFNLMKRGESEVTDKEIISCLCDSLNTQSHEDAHVELAETGQTHWGHHHNETFYNKQEALLGNVVVKQSNVTALFRELARQYPASCLERDKVMSLFPDYSELERQAQLFQ